MSDSVPYRPTPLEIASGLIFGSSPPASLPSPEEAGSPIEALERAILPALRRAPCLLSFSGGPASSVVLAVAVRLARREGLELPIPATIRFPYAEPRVHRESQERVIVHLGLTNWARFEFDAELDAVGPVAMRLLRRHGLLAPFEVHFHMPLIDEASGGSLITGLGGRDALDATGLREAVIGHWLRPAARDEACSRLVADLSAESIRRTRIRMDSLAYVARALRVEVVHPLAQPHVSVALGGLAGWARRTLFGDFLPIDLLAGRPAPLPHSSFWNEHSRDFVDGWDGEGIDPELVDAEALSLEWTSDEPDPRTLLLLQSVALAREGQSVARQLAQAVGGLG